MPKKQTPLTRTRVSHLTLAKLIQCLLTHPAGVDELEAWTGLSRDTLYRFMNAMHKERVVHISGWDVDSINRPSMPIYKLGPGEDVPRTSR